MDTALSAHQFSPMSPETLEKILGYLPEPTSVEVRLFGEFDYSDIARQFQGVSEGLEVETPGDLVFRLKNPSKEKVLDMYRKSRLPIEEGSRAYPPELDKKEEIEAWTHKQVLEYAKLQNRVALHRISWHLDGVQIELTPYKMKIEYSGQEPEYISRMRKELAPQTEITLFFDGK